MPEPTEPWVEYHPIHEEAAFNYLFEQLCGRRYDIALTETAAVALATWFIELTDDLATSDETQAPYVLVLNMKEAATAFSCSEYPEWIALVCSIELSKEKAGVVELTKHGHLTSHDVTQTPDELWPPEVNVHKIGWEDLNWPPYLPNPN